MAARGPIVLVPTMGALHDGHIALIRQARHLAGSRGSVIVSIFVNPTQFGPKEDFAKYPRPFARDRRICRTEKVDVVFAPEAPLMYPEGYSTWVHETSLSQTLCGRSRPGHFQGVCTVVTKLFNILQPDAAVFGLKDFQQFAIIRKITAELHMPVQIIPVPTVRESDGLALSSRNQYLSPEERREAPRMQQLLQRTAESIRAGRTVAAARRDAIRAFDKIPLAKLDYFEIVDPVTLAPTKRSSDILLAAAAWFGRTRLIDNLWLR
jgi:pantoate--beta-alanine ligase